MAISELEGNFFLPLWPFNEFAELGKHAHWSTFTVVEISINTFEDIYIPIIEKRDYLINVFPVGETTGFVVDLKEFLRDLREELSQYE